MNITRIAAGLVLAGLSGSVLAATTAEVTVTGTIKPTACTLTLNSAAEATVDYGVIALNLLSATAITPLTVKRVPLKIVCDAATQVAVNAFDNKAGSNPFTTGTVDVSDAGDESALDVRYLYGLGGADKKTGGYSISLNYATAKVDAKTAYLIGTINAASSWYTANNGSIGKGSAGANVYWRTWSATSASVIPLTGTTFEADILVKAFINKKSELNLTGESGELALDGSATIEVRYL